ncbi:MAG: GGDEF domain-containing protein [Lachnospiraceae bacterium]|nr:GGDEF domain-containing protein [Lachnospiraceae bacterium]
MKTSIKKKKDKKLSKYIWVGYAVFSMFLVVYLANNLLCKDIMNVSNRLILNDNWNISINDTEYNNVALDSVKFDAVEKGDIILMETTLPKDWNFGQAALCIHNRHTALSMFIDDELEYQYGYERVEQNKTTGSGYLLINIYDSYKGKNLKLELAVTEMNAFSSFDSIWISEWNNSYRYIITENRLPMILGSFLVVFGFLVAFISIFAVTISKKYRNVLCLSLFSMCIGIWTLCYYNVVMVFSIPLYSISLMEYMSLFLAPIPILGYMYSYVKELQNNKFMIIYKFLFAVQIALTSVTIILHTTDTIHGVQSLPLYQVLFVIHSLYFSYVLYKNMKKNKMMRKFSLIGLFIVVACILYDLCSYSIFRYYGKHIINLRGMSSLGILIFIVILILDLYYRITRSMMEEQEKAILIKRAYTD